MISEEDTDKYLAEVLDILKERFDGGDIGAASCSLFLLLPDETAVAGMAAARLLERVRSSRSLRNQVME
jgi:hypothetical protein